MPSVGRLFSILVTVLLMHIQSRAADAPASRPSHEQAALDAALRKVVDARDNDKAKSLLESGANLRPHGDFSPFYRAVVHGDFRIAELLLKHGADPNDPDESCLPLACAACVGNVDAIKFLLAHGANPSAQLYHRAPLHFAASMGQVESVRLLLAAGADVNALDKQGKTPLQDAILGESDRARLRAKRPDIAEEVIRNHETVQMLLTEAATRPAH